MTMTLFLICHLRNDRMGSFGIYADRSDLPLKFECRRLKFKRSLRQLNSQRFQN